VQQPASNLSAQLAVENNHQWYLAILGAHGVPSRLDEHYWSAEAPAPLYYSQLVTRTFGEVAERAQLSRIAELARLFRGRGWGIKDSHDRLGDGVLQDLGLRRLFRACWYGWAAPTAPAAPARESSAEAGLELLPVRSAAELFDWETHWRVTSPAGEARIFPAQVLAETSLQLFSARREGRVVGGFALNLSQAAVGLSNVFHAESEPAAAFVRDCARCARSLHPQRAVVGYGPESELSSLAPLGFVALGPLSVWVSAS
jgi:hypothetical protein